MSVEAMAWALRVPIGGTAKVILLGIANHAGADFGDARPSVATLAEYAHCDRRTVQRNLRRLEAERWIERTGEFGRADRRVTVWRCTGRQYAAPVAGERGDAHAAPQTDHGAAPVPPREAERGGASVASGAAPVPPEPSNEPSNERTTSSHTGGESAVDEVRIVFDEWVRATGRDPKRTKLTPERRRLIAKALASHGLEDCLAAVRNIGADAWARGHNDRGQRFDGIEHALGNAARIERWRDAVPRTAPGLARTMRNARDLSRFDRFDGREAA